MLASLGDVVSSMTHPYGSAAFAAPAKQRGAEAAGAAPPRRQVGYGDDEAPADAATAPELAPAAAPAVPAPPKAGLKRLRKSVALPHWMDLDQETLPHKQVVALVDTTTGKDPNKMSRPAKLDAFGPVGELTVQMRTARGSELEFDELLSRHASAPAVVGKKVPDGYVCHRCKKPGHWIQDCPLAEEAAAAASSSSAADGAVRPPPASYVCHRCGVPGHWIQYCPHKQGAAKPAAPKKTARREVGIKPESGILIRPAIAIDAAAEGGGEGGVCGECEGDGGGDGDGPSSKRGKGRAPPPGYICHACNVPGHWVHDCPRYDEYKEGKPPDGYVCRRCNQAGHWKANCKAVIAAPKEAAPAAELPIDAEAREVGGEIAEGLKEEGVAVEQVVRVAAMLGEEASRELLVQAWQIEEVGGLLTTDGTNVRRTPGGVFFWLVKQRATAAQRAQIWPESASKRPPKPRERKAKGGPADGEGAPEASAMLKESEQPVPSSSIKFS